MPRSAWTHWLLCCYAATNCDALCTPLHQNQHELFSAVWAALTRLLDQTTQASLYSSHAWVNLSCPWHCRLFTTVPSTADQDRPTIAAVLQMLWQAPNSLQSLHLSFLPACNINFEGKRFTSLSNVSLSPPPPQTGAMMKSVFFTAPGNAHNVMPHLPRILFSSLWFQNLVCS